ncbi:hypothetical protein TST_0463 [Thermosulfidibacter takaii ABI70S6]|uniref:Acetoacetate decarboxylase n=1 Tax=Thermosulfidibacter takaii (strain DSM 17441 / JCM 13301 / NBRC 103674 / ABI70S6) TaxID=1298851 RepID=A0A0S3QSJ9_THET7|nr:acetoacetate decarboxylase family protein [Thermosulfidibacter takaii]BAT71271.1 hypothetical protein TST_0463 [Thermosulfidibacter takaii ABI70S6]
MDGFFDKIISYKVTYDTVSFELPILYFREDSFLLFFSASLDKVKSLMPCKDLYPVPLNKNRAVVGIAAFNYTETTIGPYGELGIAIPVVYGKNPIPLIPLLREANDRGFGMLVMHLPVTNKTAMEAGIQEWGYPKFVADMEFTITPEFGQCRLHEGDKHILTLRVPRKGIVRKDNRPLITYSVKDGKLIRTTIPQKAIYLTDLFPPDAHLELGEHPVANFLKEIDIGKKPIASRFYLYRPAILPRGEVVANGVNPIERYRSDKEEGTLTVKYRRIE